MKSKIIITETREDGVYYQYNLPESATMDYLRLDVVTDPDGSQRVAEGQLDGLNIRWPDGEEWEIVTNDPEVTEEVQS